MYTLILFSIQMSSYSSKHTYEDILQTTKYASFLLCSQLYHSNLFRSHFASIKLSLADDLDNLCQPKRHSKLMSIIICQENHTMNNLLTSDLDDLEPSREEVGMWGLGFTIHLFFNSYLDSWKVHFSFFLLCRKDSKLSMF